MMTNTERELRRLISEAGFGDITVTMKCNGDEVTISPCNFSEVKSFENTEYYFVYSPKVMSWGHETLDGVAQFLLSYSELVDEHDEDVERLKAHIREYGEDSDWDFVSDYHKDLYGHRPHVGSAKLIAWANSNSMCSARFF